MGLYHKNYTPADEGFEAARKENFEEAIEARRKKLQEGLAAKGEIKKQREEELKNKKQLEILKDPNLAKSEGYLKAVAFDKSMQKLLDKLDEQQKKIDELIASDKKVHEEISEEEHEFVESIETRDTGGGYIVDEIRFKHTDVIIVVNGEGMTVWESAEDFDAGDTSKVLFDLEFEEMEKVDISDTPERKKTGIKKLDALIETYDQINADADGDDHRMPLKAKNYDYYVEELDAHNYDEEQKNLFLGWLSKQK